MYLCLWFWWLWLVLLLLLPVFHAVGYLLPVTVCDFELLIELGYGGQHLSSILSHVFTKTLTQIPYFGLQALGIPLQHRGQGLCHLFQPPFRAGLLLHCNNPVHQKR
jgi:hypothetical protein